MPKFEYESQTEPTSAYFERRRLRRVRTNRVRGAPRALRARRLGAPKQH